MFSHINHKLADCTEWMSAKIMAANLFHVGRPPYGNNRTICPLCASAHGQLSNHFRMAELVNLNLEHLQKVKRR